MIGIVRNYGNLYEVISQKVNGCSRCNFQAIYAKATIEGLQPLPAGHAANTVPVTFIEDSMRLCTT